jgi:hypothetical protein
MFNNSTNINTTYPISLSNTITTQFDKRDLIVVGDTFQGYTIKKKVDNGIRLSKALINTKGKH